MPGGTVKNGDREEERDDLRDRFLVGAGTQTIKNQEERRGIDFDVVVEFVERTHTRLARESLAVGFCGSKFVREWKILGVGRSSWTTSDVRLCTDLEGRALVSCLWKYLLVDYLAVARIWGTQRGLL